MTEELKNMLMKLQVSNARTENLMDNINAVKRISKQYEKCLIEELKISEELANKIRLELLMNDATMAQTGRR